MSGDNDILVQLARMEGKLDVTNERLNNVQTEIADIRRVQHRHSDRLGLLENDKNMRTGERNGLALGGRLAWAGIGLIPGGAIVAGLMRLLGS